MDGAEGAGSLNEFDQLVVACQQPHWARKGPETAERKVRGNRMGFKFRTGAEEGETEGGDEAEAGGNHVAGKGLGGGVGSWHGAWPVGDFRENLRWGRLGPNQVAVAVIQLVAGTFAEYHAGFIGV